VLRVSENRRRCAVTYQTCVPTWATTTRLQFLYLDYWSGDDTVSLSVPIGEVDPRSRGECGSGW
jgi:hypothetical protein